MQVEAISSAFLPAGIAEDPCNVEYFAALVRYCRDNKLLQTGKQAHERLTEAGFSGDRYLSNLLIEMYGKCGSLSDARAVFNRMNNRNTFSWTNMISSHVEHDLTPDSALQLFQKMLLEGFRPRDSFVYTSLLGACASVGSPGLKQGVWIHSLLLEEAEKFSADVLVGTALVNMYGKCACVQRAEFAFEWMKHRNLTTWNSMIDAFARNGYLNEALEMFHELLLEGLKPDSVTLIIALNACSAAKALAQGKLIHQVLLSGDESHAVWSDRVVVETSLANMFVRCGDIASARQMFNQMEVRNLVSWNVMLLAYVQQNHISEATLVFRSMELEGVKPDSFTFTSLLALCSQASAAKALQERIITTGFFNSSNLIVSNAILAMHGRVGDVSSAELVFQSMVERDVVSWNALITAYSQQDCYHLEAREAYHRMSLSGVKPSSITFLAVIGACRDLSETRVIQHLLEHCQLHSNTDTGTALINKYASLGCLIHARRGFDQMMRNEVAWTSMLVAHAQHQREFSGVVEYYTGMNLEGWLPNEVTFIGILFSCSHKGLVEPGLSFFRTMINDHSIQPLPDHLVCVLDLLAKAGFLSDVEDYLRNNNTMLVAHETCRALLNTLLGACKIHADAQTGKRAAELALAGSNVGCGGFVLLSDMCVVPGIDKT